MSVSRVVDERVLAPISAEKPSGEDLSSSAEWVAIRRARPNIYDTGTKGEWQPAEPVKTDWPSYKELVEKALCTRTKDLRLAIFLVESCTRLHGFAGVRDGLWTIQGLIANFADKGLYPLPEDGDLELQYGQLEWLNEKLADIIREIPITFRPEPAVNYSLKYREESLRKDGLITAAEFEGAVAPGTKEQYEKLNTEVAEAQLQLHELECVASVQFGETSLSFVETKQALEDCKTAISTIVRKKQGAAKAAAAAGAAPGATISGAALMPTVGSATSGTASADSWAEAEQLAYSGNLDGALTAMAALAASEPNGRIRFQRKLLLADICLQTNRHRLAKSVLEELNELIEKHRLTEWEKSELVGAVWTRLYRCYRNEAAGIANSDKASEILLKLSRLDPWQAMSCGDTK